MKDLTEALHYLPYGLAAGVAVLLLLRAVNAGRCKRGVSPLPEFAIAVFFTYLVILLVITFWSRESSGSAQIDLQFFSTWGINTRNNALVIENVLLFMPYGFLCPLVLPKARRVGMTVLCGLATSVGVELLQLITGRGYFQIDDILTNTLGAMLGFVLWVCLCKNSHR